MPSAASHLAGPPSGVRCLGTALESGAEAPHSKNLATGSSGFYVRRLN